MKKTFVGAVAALLFMFCFSLHPVSAQAAEHMLQMENDEWVCYTAGQRDNSYTGMAVNEYGWWYMKEGEIEFYYTDQYRIMREVNKRIKDEQKKNCLAERSA